MDSGIPNGKTNSTNQQTRNQVAHGQAPNPAQNFLHAKIKGLISCKESNITLEILHVEGPNIKVWF